MKNQRHSIAIFFLFFSLIAATSLLHAPSAFALSAQEEARIEKMLSLLAKQTDTVFIRNGSEHTATQAVSHLRLKLGKTKKRLSTAEQFIDKVASTSSISGKPYLIRTKGGKEEPAGPFLKKLLQQASQ